MKIPNDMRHILALALQDACRLAGCGGEQEIHDAYMAALEWLRAQPVLPEQWELVSYSDDAIVIDEGVRVWLADSLEPDEWLHLPPGMCIVRPLEAANGPS